MSNNQYKATQSTPQQVSVELLQCHWLQSQYARRALRVSNSSSCYFVAVNLNTISPSRVNSALFVHRRQDKCWVCIFCQWLFKIEYSVYKKFKFCYYGAMIDVIRNMLNSKRIHSHRVRSAVTSAQPWYGVLDKVTVCSVILISV